MSPASRRSSPPEETQEKEKIMGQLVDGKWVEKPLAKTDEGGSFVRVAETVNPAHIKGHYYGSHRHIDPNGTVPKGPAIDYAAPHDRQSVEIPS
jgi:glutathionyl-hydroquinone reductase